jgi:uncharacterized protein YdeI (YjbR/CyaY-like superfamily)
MPMKNANPEVDWYFDKVKKWQPEVNLLRAIPLGCGLAEVLKWGSPCYALHGNNVVLIHTFKDYCAFLFFKGALLNDSANILIQQTKNVQAARHIRFTDAKSIKKLKPVLKAYILQAIEVEKSGAKVAMKHVSDYPVAEEFQRRLDQLPSLNPAFEGLTPGRRKAYLFHFAGAKKSETREARVEKCIPRILDGIGLDD